MLKYVEWACGMCKHTGFPEDQLLADTESAVYEALSLHNSALDTFFNPKVISAALCLRRYHHVT